MVKVLHIFNQYLNKTEQWAFQLLSNTHNCDQHIAAKVFHDYKPGRELFSFMENPLSDLEEQDQQTDWKKNIIKKAFIRTTKKLSKSFDQLLEEYIAQHNIQLMHAHFANLGWEVIDVKNKTEIPLVVSFYGWDYEMLPHVKPEWKEKYLELFREADLILTEGDHGKSTLIAMGCEAHKVEVQKLGIARNTINQLQRQKKKNELKLIQIASYTEKKGQLDTVKAFAEASAKCPEMHLTLIGDSRDDAYKSSVDEAIMSLNLRDKVSQKDFLPYEELGKELQQHHVFIHPSRYAENMNCEGGAPTILFNAAGSGMPTISTTHCDIPSVVIDGKTGMLTDEKKPKALAGNIERFYRMDDHEYNEYATASHNHISKNYSIEENGKDLSNFYNTLIKDLS